MVRWTLPIPTVCGAVVAVAVAVVVVVVVVVVESGWDRHGTDVVVVARDAVERVVLCKRANRIMLVGVLGSGVLDAQFLGACVQVRWWWWKGQVGC